MKIIKIAALVVVVLGIFGISFWFTSSSEKRKSPKPWDDITSENVDDKINYYVENFECWDTVEYQKMEDGIRLAMSYSDSKEQLVDYKLNRLQRDTEARIKKLLKEELDRQGCNFKTASNLGDGLKYFYDKKEKDDRVELEGLYNRYRAYYNVYWFVQNPIKELEPNLEIYLKEWESDDDDPIKKGKDNVNNKVSEYRNQMQKHGLNHINKLNEGFKNIDEKFKSMISGYYKELDTNFTEYCKQQQEYIAEATNNVVPNANSEAELDTIYKKYEGILQEIQYYNTNIGDIDKAYDAYKNNAYNSHKNYKESLNNLEDAIDTRKSEIKRGDVSHLDMPPVIM